MLQVKIRKDIPNKLISSGRIEKSELTTVLLSAINTVLAGKSESVIHTEHSLTELGANSFDVVRIVHLLEQQLTNITGTRVHTVEWYEPLLAKSIEEVIDIIHDSLTIEQASRVYGRKRELLQSRIDNLGSGNKVFKVETSTNKAMMSTHRRGIIAFNNR